MPVALPSLLSRLPFANTLQSLSELTETLQECLDNASQDQLSVELGQFFEDQAELLNELSTEVAHANRKVIPAVRLVQPKAKAS